MLSIFESMGSRGHEEVVFCQDKDTGLRAIIAIHNTTIGPALGGCRMWNYNSDGDALVFAWSDPFGGSWTGSTEAE